MVFCYACGGSSQYCPTCRRNAGRVEFYKRDSRPKCKTAGWLHCYHFDCGESLALLQPHHRSLLSQRCSSDVGSVAAAAAFENTAAGQSFENKYYPRSGGNSTPPASPAPPAGSGTPSTPATTPSGQTLDAIYKKIIATASADPNFTGSGSSLTGLPDHFNVYLGLAAPGLTVPISVFSDPNTPITAPRIGR